MKLSLDPLRVALAVVLLGSAILFAIGASVERSKHPAKAAEVSHNNEGSSSTEVAAVSESERLLGINPESTALTALAVALSVLLAAGVLVRGRRELLLALIPFGLVFTALDCREAVHQLDESRSSLVAIALVLAVLHAGVVALAGTAFRRA